MNKHALSRIATVAAAGTDGRLRRAQNPDPRDPWEGFNRGVYKFNDSVDRVVFKPVAQAYTYVTPQPVRSCVHNIFSNVGDLWSGANSMLQGRGHDFVNTLGRFLFNTTMGVGGCFDVASANGARKIPNDFGTTLGVWGIGQGPYLVLPFFGSSTIRDGVGLAGDFYGRKATYTSISAIDNVPLRNSLWGLSVVDARASLLDATNTIDRVALDPYSFVRDAYLQRRAAMVLGQKVGDESALPNYEDDEDDAKGAAPPWRRSSSPPSKSTPPLAAQGEFMQFSLFSTFKRLAVAGLMSLAAAGQCPDPARPQRAGRQVRAGRGRPGPGRAQERRRGQSGNTTRINQVVDQHILPYVNFQKTTRLAAGRYWRQANDKQKHDLAEAFRGTLVRTYSGALTRVDNNTKVTLVPSRGSLDGDDVVVRTQISQTNAAPVGVDYRLEKTPQGWKIYDMNVEGIWLIENYRNQFAQQINQNGIDGLIQALNQRNQ